MFQDWRETLLAHRAEWGLPAGAHWEVLFHNNYQQTGSTINLLWFYGDGKFPRVVTKMSPDRGVLEREFRCLQTVYAVAQRFVPRPIHLGSADGFAMLWMEGVPGRRIPPGGGRYTLKLAGWVDMLVSIHRALRAVDGAPADDRHTRMVAEPVGAVLCSATSEAVRQGCHQLMQVASPEWLNTLPVIPQHADLYLDNLLLYRNDCHIVDWENFGAVDLPFHDLLTLFVSLLRTSAVAPERWVPDLRTAIPPLIERYARGLQLPSSAVETILPLTLANWFYLHWIEGHAAAEVMYGLLEHYFEHTAYWREVFLGARHI